MTVIQVVNTRNSTYDEYIGRGSIWGNPFTLPRYHTDADRDQVIARYERYLLGNPGLMSRLPELCGKRLGCFCAPKRCHGDILKQYAEAWERDSAVYSHVLLITGPRTWDDVEEMRRTFTELWREWGPDQVARPLLVFGACPDGADAMAGSLWRSAGFDTMPCPADWRAHGRSAGVKRNQEMVVIADGLRRAGSQVTCRAFLDLCRKSGCPQRDQQQLMPGRPGHFSHGTIDCRRRAIAMGFQVADVSGRH
ncbi:DUF4326 domain-containing protein [Amycolatopsis azurea]|uniref:DUF4326 domain-containing protein n=1 Tax=Amycolatopsis azurea TaxID=36819 RepID=UPI00382BE302